MDEHKRALVESIVALEERLAAAEVENLRLISENVALKRKLGELAMPEGLSGEIAARPEALGYRHNAGISGTVDDLLEKIHSLEAYFSLSLDLLCIANTNGEFIRLNPEWQKVLGYSEAELKGRKFLEFVHPDDVQATIQAIHQLGNNQEVLNFENRYRGIDGSYRWIEWRSRPHGNLIYAAARDITEQKRAEEELLTSNELLGAFITHSPIYAFIKAVSPTESRVLRASENFQEMIGIPGSEMTNKTMHELFPAEFADKISQDDWRVVSGGEILRLDEELNGRYYTTIKFPILRENKKFLAGYTIDLTERRHAEEALRESEETFRNIVHASPMGIHLYQLQDDNTLIFTGANPAADKLLRVNNAQFIGKTLEEAFPPLRDTEVSYRYLRAALHGESWKTEHIDYVDGEIAGAFEVNVFQMAPGKVAVLFNEISSRKRAEDEKEKLQAQLIQAQKMESVGRLAGGVAHDFNNMLGVILGHTELAMKKLDISNPIHDNLESIRKAAERSVNLTRQLLAFARKQTVAPKILDLNETIEGMLSMVVRLIGEDIELVWVPGQGLDAVKMDPSQIDQILVNLCVNARDAIGDTGKVTIETGAVSFDKAFCSTHAGFLPGDYVLLAVSDNGCGMDQETLSHLFEPFFTTKEVGKGTGLGLATVYGIVKQNSGFITVYSEPELGTLIKIYLPPYQTERERPARVEEMEGAERGHETILLVEDEPMILDLTHAMLETLGYTVLSAASPGQAMRLAQDHSGVIHLLMTDVVMPEMNGRDLARNILRLYPDIKRLFMSGYTANVIAHHGVLDEGVHFLQKPFNLQDLAAKVRGALD